jgi:signal transduction histidine kinase/ligand-binding sensor domain-containing protein
MTPMPSPARDPGRRRSPIPMVGPIPLLAALCALLCCAPALAQYRFDHWSAANGLPQNSVRDILQTRDGYLWFTTYDGLVRFDGVRFTVLNKSNSPGLPGNRFVDLFEDRSGNLWATLQTGEVVKWQRGRFAVYPDVQQPVDDISSTLGEDAQGNVVVRYQEWDYEGPQNVLTRIRSRAYRLRGAGREPADDLSQSFVPVPFVGESLEGSFSEVLDGELFICNDERIVRLGGDGRVKVYDQRNGLPGAQPALVSGRGLPLRAVTRDAAGRLWLTELESGRSELLSTHAPEGFDVLRGYSDAEGNYWFSTYNAGLFRARRQTVTPYGKAQGLDVREVYPLVETRDGALWIGSGGEGLFRMKDGAFTRYALLPPFPAMVNSLYEDRAGQLWVNGAWRFADGQFVPAAWMATLPDTRFLACQAMGEDSDGALWVGTGAGVARHRDGVSTYYTTKDGLAGNDTKVVLDDGAGGVWLGGYGGLTRVKNGRFQVWTEKDGLPGNTVRALKRDEDGTLWIGTYDSGLGRFRDGRFTTYTTKDGLFDNGVFQILEDANGFFWMSCNRGIFRVRKQELHDFAEGRIKSVNSLAYNENDGMVSSECNGGRWPAGVKTRDGKLWFPTMGGVAMIDPARITANTQPPPVVLEQMRINNEPAPFDVWERALHDPRAAMRILPGQDNFEIQYTALSFIDSEHMRFRYRLEGADDDWVEAGTRRAAYFSHLSPGDYTFRVIAANADGVWNETGAKVRITVVPPFWRTWWFLTLVALVSAGVIFSAWRFREAHLERIQRAHEDFARQLIASQEKERKRIAGELHDSLGQSLVIIRNWAMLGASQVDPGAPAREELDEIDAVASRSIGEVREIAYNLGPYHLERLGFEKSIRDMVTRVAKASGIAITAELDPLDGALGSDSAMSVYRIAQEALNNVVKHSGASEAKVRLTREAAGVRLAVADNGRGFDHHVHGHSGFGLNGMAERVRLLGGTLSIRSAPGEGTTVETLLPETRDRTAVREDRGDG